MSEFLSAIAKIIAEPHSALVKHDYVRAAKVLLFIESDSEGFLTQAELDEANDLVEKTK